VAIHRLRRDFRSAVEAEIAQTLPCHDDLADELRYLVEVLSEPVTAARGSPGTPGDASRGPFL
jgi:hypothetical protein